jgi:spermidine/putrescine transport system permease protein
MNTSGIVEPRTEPKSTKLSEWFWRIGGWVLLTTAIIILVFLYAPIVVLILFSFNSVSSLNLPIVGFTLRWYESALQDPALISGLQQSMKVGLITAIFSTALGTIGAFAIARREFRLKSTIQNLAIVPMTIPTLLLGVALLIFFHRIHLTRSVMTIIIGHITFTLPFVLVIVTSSLAGFDVNIEEAARDLGASSFKTLIYVTLPIIFPAVIASFLLTFTLSFDDFIVAFMTTGTETTLPLVIWSMLRFGLSLKVNAMASLIMVFSFSMLALVVIIMSRRSTRTT